MFSIGVGLTSSSNTSRCLDAIHFIILQHRRVGSKRHIRTLLDATVPNGVLATIAVSRRRNLLDSKRLTHVLKGLLDDRISDMRSVFGQEFLPVKTRSVEIRWGWLAVEEIRGNGQVACASKAISQPDVISVTESSL